MVNSPTPEWSDTEQDAQPENEGVPPSLEELGITRMMTETYLVAGYRYSKLADAVAQVHRMSGKAARKGDERPQAASSSTHQEAA